MTDNPYRCTVKVRHGASAWWMILSMNGSDPKSWSFPTEAEANANADMILAALQGATRE